MSLLETYAAEHGASVQDFLNADWREEGNKLLFKTDGGFRYRHFEGPAKYTSTNGYKNVWYRLREAVEIAHRVDHPLILCNGEASVVATQANNIPAVCDWRRKEINSTRFTSST
jgi:hypothetical protein